MKEITAFFLAAMMYPALFAELIESFDLTDNAQIAIDAAVAFADEQK